MRGKKQTCPGLGKAKGGNPRRDTHRQSTQLVLVSGILATATGCQETPHRPHQPQIKVVLYEPQCTNYQTPELSSFAVVVKTLTVPN